MADSTEGFHCTATTSKSTDGFSILHSEFGLANHRGALHSQVFTLTVSEKKQYGDKEACTKQPVLGGGASSL